MNHEITNLNKSFDSRIRLGIMSILMVNDKVEFSELRDQLSLTDGNLASHITALEKLAYIDVIKQFIGKKPNTTYKVTIEGREAFNKHLDALEALLKIRK